MQSLRKRLKAKSERARACANVRWSRDRARRDAEEPARLREMELARILGEGPPEPGEYIGTLQWSDRSGTVRRWTVRRGERAGSIRIDGVAKPRTMTWLLDRLRRHLAAYGRTPTP
jgi:hypothetical protein